MYFWHDIKNTLCIETINVVPYIHYAYITEETLGFSSNSEASASELLEDFKVSLVIVATCNKQMSI